MNIKKACLRLLCFYPFLSAIHLDAQKASSLSSRNHGDIAVLEKKMQRLGYQLLGDTSHDNRVKGAREFIKVLVEALKIENSFHYRFDSLPYLAKIYSPDSSFRIFTFQVILKNYTYKHYGAIQLNSKSLKLIPFKDYSDTFNMTPQGILTNKNWLGAVYYRCFMKYVEKKPLFFLIGYDQNDALSDKKYIEPMRIIGDTMAVFGYPIFEKPKAISGPPPRLIIDPKTGKPLKVDKPMPMNTLNRVMIEYRKGGTAVIKYDPDKERILIDHIVSEDKKYTDVGYMKMPDGTYEGYEWKNNKFVWKENITVAEKDVNIKEYRPVPKKESKLFDK